MRLAHRTELGGRFLSGGTSNVTPSNGRWPRLSVVSTVWPTPKSGQGKELYLLLDAVLPLENETTCVFFSGDQDEVTRQKAANLPLETYPLTPKIVVPRLGAGRIAHLIPDLIRDFDYRRRVLSAIRSRAAELVAAMSSRKVELLIGCSGEIFDIPAACIAARSVGVPLIIYSFDDFVNQWTHPVLKRIAHDCLVDAATFVGAFICPNEDLAEAYRQRYPVSPVIICNPFPSTSEIPDGHAFPSRRPDPRDPLKIVYTGSIYDTQIDSFERMMEVLDSFDGGVELHIYCNHEVATHHRAIFSEKHTRWHGYIDYDRCLAVQKTADILFLPLAFDSIRPEVILTASPRKTAEYLASGRPMLVHAPAESFVSKLFGQYECGIVVDHPDSSAIVDAIVRLSSDTDLVRRLTENAKKLSGEFSVETSANRFRSVVLDAVAT